MKRYLFLISIFSLIFLLFVCFSCEQKAKESNLENKGGENTELSKIPDVIMDGLESKFPDAKINKWTKEKEDNMVIYDIEFSQKGQKLEADIKEDGTIQNWEKEITVNDIPEAVKKSVEIKYPGSTLKEIMQVTSVINGKDSLEGYEIVLETVKNKVIEITLAPDGKLLEESGNSR